ncbi:MAG: hypothetical protein GY838_13465 [bacterium]|nr:hypothetical protein [bacterium]
MADEAKAGGAITIRNFPDRYKQYMKVEIGVNRKINKGPRTYAAIVMAALDVRYSNDMQLQKDDDDRITAAMLQRATGAETPDEEHLKDLPPTPDFL